MTRRGGRTPTGTDGSFGDSGDGYTGRKRRADPTPRAFTTPEFKKLQREWASKLKADGFKDIEREDGSLCEDFAGDPIGSANRKDMRNMSGMVEIAPVYRLGEQWINEYVWDNRRRRWHYAAHLAGESLKEIFFDHPAIPDTTTYSGFVHIYEAVRNAMLRAHETAGTDEEIES